MLVSSSSVISPARPASTTPMIGTARVPSPTCRIGVELTRNFGGETHLRPCGSGVPPYDVATLRAG